MFKIGVSKMIIFFVLWIVYSPGMRSGIQNGIGLDFTTYIYILNKFSYFEPFFFFLNQGILFILFYTFLLYKKFKQIFC